MAREDQEREAGRKALAELDKDIKEKSFRRAYLFCGEEDYLRASYRSRLAAAVSGGDTMNVRNFEGKGVEADRVVAAGESLPFFADYMLVIVRDSGRAGGFPGQCAGYHGDGFRRGDGGQAQPPL